MQEYENGEKNEFMADLMNRMPMLREKSVDTVRMIVFFHCCRHDSSLLVSMLCTGL